MRRRNRYGYRRKTSNRYYGQQSSSSNDRCAACGRYLGNRRAVQQDDGTWFCSDCDRYGTHED